MSKVIIFDVDGTLIDTKKGIIMALNHVLDVFNKESIGEAESARYVGPPIKNSLIDFQHFLEDDAIKATQLYRKLYVERYIEQSTVYPYIAEVVHYLKKKEIIIGIATMKTKPQIDKIMEMFFGSFNFDVIKTANDKGSVTKKQMLSKIKQEYSDAEEFIMIGDTLGDYQAAESEGFRFVAADYGYGDLSKVQGWHVQNGLELLNSMKHYIEKNNGESYE